MTFLARSAPVHSAAARGAVLVLHDITALRTGGPDPPRLRRQRVPRAAHAADGRSRLRGSAARRRRPMPTTCSGSSKPSPGTRCGWSGSCATCCGWRGSTPDRIRSSACRARSIRSSPAVAADLAGRSLERRQQMVRDIAAGAEAVSADPAKLHDALRNLLENATNYSPEAATISMSAERRGERDRPDRRGFRVRVFHRRICPVCSSASIASTRRARAARAIPGGTGPRAGDRQAPDRAAGWAHHARRTGPAVGGDVYNRTSVGVTRTASPERRSGEIDGRVDSAAPIAAAAGIVSIHAHTIRPATPQRTADNRRVEPTPMMAPVIVWVVLTGHQNASP